VSRRWIPFAYKFHCLPVSATSLLSRVRLPCIIAYSSIAYKHLCAQIKILETELLLPTSIIVYIYYCLQFDCLHVYYYLQLDCLQALLPTALLPIYILFTIKYYFIFSPVSTRSDSHPTSHSAKGRTTSIIVLLHMFSTREYYDSFLWIELLSSILINTNYLIILI